MAAQREMVEKGTESTPNEHAAVYESTLEQTGLQRPMRSAGVYTPSITRWLKAEHEQTKHEPLAVQKRKTYDRLWGQGNTWDRYGDSLSTTSAEETRRKGAQGRRESQWQDWSPWSAAPAPDRPAQPVISYNMKPVNRGESPWTSWTKEKEAQAGQKDIMKLDERLTQVAHLAGADLPHGLPRRHRTCHWARPCY